MTTVRASRVVGNVLYNYAGLLLSTAIGFGLTPVLIRHLGHTSYGLYVLICSMIGFAGLLDFGIGITVMRLVAAHAEDEDPSQLGQVISSGIALYSALGLAVLLVAGALFPFLGTVFGITGPRLTAFEIAFAVSAGSLVVTFPAAVYVGINQGLHDFRGPIAIALGQTALSGVGMLAAVELGGGLVAISSVAAGVSLLSFFARVVYTVTVHSARFRLALVRRAELARILRISAWLIIGNLAVTVIFSIDSLVVGLVLNAVAVASFAVTVGATSAMQGLGSSMNSVLLATATTLRARRDSSGTQRLLLESIRMTAVVLGPFVVLAAIWGRQLFKVWVGAQFESSAPTLLVLALGMAVALMQAAAAQFVIASGKQKRLIFVSVPEAIANLILSVVLARWLGIVGVAFGTAIPTVFTTFVIVIPYACRLTGTSVAMVYRRAALPAVVQAGAYMFLRFVIGPASFSNLFALAAASLVVIGTCFVACLAAEPRERRTYIDMVRQRAVGAVDAIDKVA